MSLSDDLLRKVGALLNPRMYAYQKITGEQIITQACLLRDDNYSAHSTKWILEFHTKFGDIEGLLWALSKIKADMNDIDNLIAKAKKFGQHAAFEWLTEYKTTNFPQAHPLKAMMNPENVDVKRQFIFFTLLMFTVPFILYFTSRWVLAPMLALNDYGTDYLAVGVSALSVNFIMGFYAYLAYKEEVSGAENAKALVNDESGAAKDTGEVRAGPTSAVRERRTKFVPPAGFPYGNQGIYGANGEIVYHKKKEDGDLKPESVTFSTEGIRFRKIHKGKQTQTAFRRINALLRRMTSVYLYVPNLIGYTRIILALAAYYFAFDSWMLFLALYGASEFMDALDGHAARYYNQSTSFGAVLDQVTDRCSTAGVMILLAVAYPKWAALFVFLLFLDIFAHWFQMYASLAVGQESHKKVPNSRFLLKVYYEIRPLMFIAHGCNEAVFMGLFVLSRLDPVADAGLCTLFNAGLIIAAPLALYKQITNILTLEYASNILVAYEADKKKNAKQ